MSEPQQSKKPCVDAVDRVLIAAEDLFATCGYDAVSISAIAERANVSKANIFHHFQSKRSLYIIKSSCQPFDHAADGARRNPVWVC